MDWLAEVAATLQVAPLADQDPLLHLTRDIAHGVERRFGPLTLFLMGQAVAGGEPLDEVIARVRALLPLGD